MPYKHLFINLLFVIGLGSCALEEGKETEVNITPIDSLNVFLAMPAQIELYNNTMFVLDVFNETGLIRVIDLGKKEELFSFAKRGQGANDFLHISTINIITDKEEIGLFDPANKTYRTYHYDSLLHHKDKTPFIQSLKLNQNEPIHELIKLNDGFLATGFLDAGKFALLDDSLQITDYFCQYRPKPNDNIPDNVHIRANQGSSFISSDKNLIGSIVYAANVFSVYSYQNKQITLLNDYIIKEIDYQVKNNNYNNNQEEGYVNGCFTNDAIYVLYSGEKYDPDANATYAKQIHKFNHKGELVKKYNLGRNVLDICIAHNKMYLLTHEPEPCILIYDIN